MRYILIYTLFVFPLLVTGQGRWCDVDQRFNLKSDDIELKAFLSRLQNADVANQIQNRSIIYLPVVIHVVARAPNKPVSVAQAVQQLDVLNADFSGTGANVGRLSDAFASLVGDAQMQFCLATLDPAGMPTTGITYTQTTVANIALQTGEGGRRAIHYDQLGGKTGWDPARYINIWIGEYGGLLGSATFPGMSSYPEEIGVIIDPGYFGAIGDAAASGFYSDGHTLTHEMGHFFGLRHIWGNSLDENCDDDDGIDDTPLAAGPYYDCPSGILESCGTSNMYQNFMDFTDDRCLAAFTHEQALLMQSVRETFYPSLALTSGCEAYAETFAAWYSQLLWAHDQPSNRYVVYSHDSWMRNKKISVFSVDGKIVVEDYWADQLSYLLDLSHVSAGVYVVRIDEGHQSYARKVIVY